MGKALTIFAFFLTLSFLVTTQTELHLMESADATHLESKPCSIQMRSYLYPVLYLGENRSNPDDSVYPGDALHYLFTFSGSDTCQSFRAHAIKSEGAFGLLSHHVIEGNNNNQDPNPKKKTIHPHNDLDMVPKYLKTTHYYVKTVTDVICHGSKGGGNNWCEEIFTLSEKPTVSVREDHEPTHSQQSKIFKYNYKTKKFTHHLLDDIVTKETFGWGFTHVGTDHKHVDTEHVNEDDVSMTSFEDAVSKACSELEKNNGCIFGHVEIDSEIARTNCLLAELEKMNVRNHDITEDNDVCVSVTDQVSLTVQGNKIQCSEKKCTSIKVKKTSYLAADVLQPALDISLSKPPLLDIDGYDAKNLDGTYYVTDPINVVHEPVFRWKDHRAKTIAFEISKEYQLKKEAELQCAYNRCDVSLVHAGMSESEWSFGNGDGLTAYNATSYDNLGTHQFHYTANVYNLGKILNTTQNSVDALVVGYFPKYDVYSYPVLEDDRKSAYDDRLGIAAHYFGSMSDGNSDDAAGLHEDRRSKINAYHYFGVAFDPWDPVTLNNTLSWSQADDVGIIHNESPVKKRHDFDDAGVIFSAKQNKSVIPFESKTGNTAMFVKAGYGKIFFAYENLTSTVFDMEEMVPRYSNSTVFVTLGSSDFAGKPATYLAYEQYLYPEALFQTDVSITAVSSTGDSVLMDIAFDVVSQLGLGAVSFADYVFEKVFYDSGDDGFSQIIFDDLYPMDTHETSSDGSLSVKVRRIASFFEQYRNIGGDNNNGTDLTNLSVENIAEKYMEESKQARLDVPLNVGMMALSPIHLNITANGITNSIDGKYFDFAESYNYTINVSTDNILNVERDVGVIIIRHDDNFGNITSLEINGEKHLAKCFSNCSVPVDTSEALEIRAYNQWGGMATASMDELPEIVPPKQSPPGKLDILYILFVIPIGFIAYRKIRSYR